MSCFRACAKFAFTYWLVEFEPHILEHIQNRSSNLSLHAQLQSVMECRASNVIKFQYFCLSVFHSHVFRDKILSIFKSTLPIFAFMRRYRILHMVAERSFQDADFNKSNKILFKRLSQCLGSIFEANFVRKKKDRICMALQNQTFA